jgi:hypothetical protein
MSRARIAFTKEATTDTASAAAAAAMARVANVADVAVRKAARAVISEAAYAAALEKRAAQAAVREARRAQGLQSWAARNEAIDARRRERVAALNAVAAEWVTEDNLAEKVDDLLDQWFISSEAAAHAQRGTAAAGDREPSHATA